jgi:hypothetical protein
MTAKVGLRRFIGPSAAGNGAIAGPESGLAWERGERQEAGRPGERCGMCAKPIAAEHGHLADLDHSALVCSCRACYLLFTHDRASGRYRAVPDRYLCDPSRVMSIPQWEELDVPVGLAFFLSSSRGEQISGFYPSPAGATECVLDLRAWRRLVREYPLLGVAEPDVEAILICRIDSGVEYFLVPVDACYALAGQMRLHWRGFDGGDQVRAAIAEFLDDVRARAAACAEAR